MEIYTWLLFAATTKKGWLETARGWVDQAINFGKMAWGTGGTLVFVIQVIMLILSWGGKLGHWIVFELIWTQHTPGSVLLALLFYLLLTQPKFADRKLDEAFQIAQIPANWLVGIYTSSHWLLQAVLVVLLNLGWAFIILFRLPKLARLVTTALVGIWLAKFWPVATLIVILIVALAWIFVFGVGEEYKREVEEAWGAAGPFFIFILMVNDLREAVDTNVIAHRTCEECGYNGVEVLKDSGLTPLCPQCTSTQRKARCSEADAWGVVVAAAKELLAEKQAALKAVQAEMANLKAIKDQQQITLLEGMLIKLQSQAVTQQQHLVSLLEATTVDQNAVDAAKRQISATQSQIRNTATQRSNLVRAEPDPAQVAAIQVRIDAAQAEVDTAQAEVSALQGKSSGGHFAWYHVFSPQSGVRNPRYHLVDGKWEYIAVISNPEAQRHVDAFELQLRTSQLEVIKGFFNRRKMKKIKALRFPGQQIGLLDELALIFTGRLRFDPTRPTTPASAPRTPPPSTSSKKTKKKDY